MLMDRRKQCLPQELWYLVWRYQPEGHCSRKLFIKWSLDWVYHYSYRDGDSEKIVFVAEYTVSCECLRSSFNRAFLQSVISQVKSQFSSLCQQGNKSLTKLGQVARTSIGAWLCNQSGMERLNHVAHHSLHPAGQRWALHLHSCSHGSSALPTTPSKIP